MIAEIESPYFRPEIPFRVSCPTHQLDEIVPRRVPLDDLLRSIHRAITDDHPPYGADRLRDDSLDGPFDIVFFIAGRRDENVRIHLVPFTFFPIVCTGLRIALAYDFLARTPSSHDQTGRQ